MLASVLAGHTFGVVKLGWVHLCSRKSPLQRKASLTALTASCTLISGLQRHARGAALRLQDHGGSHDRHDRQLVAYVPETARQLV